MAQYLHPGIYIEEVPSARTIQGASTSVAAFVGYTETGPTNEPTLITSWNDFQRQFGSTVWYGFNTWAVFEFFNEGGTACYVVRPPDTGSGKAAAASLGGIKLAAASPGKWGNTLMAYICNAVGDPNTTPPPAQAPVFCLKVVVDATSLDAATNKTDLATQLMLGFVRRNGLEKTTLGSKPYYVLESFGGLTEASLNTGVFAKRINTNSMFIRVTAPVIGSKSKTARPPNTTSPSPFSNGTAPTYNYKDSTETLKKVQRLSLLALPDTPAITDASGKPDLGLQSVTINQSLLICEELGSLFYVVDPPYGLDIQGIQNFIAGANPNSTALNSSYAAIYYPWLWVFNPIANMSVPIPPSGPVLGRYAHTDLNVGVYKSPAGVNDGALRTVVAVNDALTDTDQDLLNPYGINVVRNLINYGNVIWGARTLSQDTSWTYVCVRRLFIYVEQSLKNSLQWVVFEPNDQRLWAAVSRDISAFLTGLWAQGGLFGATAAEAFFVTCDESNNPADSRAKGQLFIDIGLAPVYPAEFVVIRITQKTAGPDAGS